MASGTPSTPPRLLDEKDLAWITSQLFQIRMQIADLTERIETVHGTQSQLQRQIRLLEIRFEAKARRDKESYNKCRQGQLEVIQWESMDE